jgi:hypothetical protein
MAVGETEAEFTHSPWLVSRGLQHLGAGSDRSFDRVIRIAAFWRWTAPGHPASS